MIETLFAVETRPILLEDPDILSNDILKPSKIRSVTVSASSKLLAEL